MIVPSSHRYKPLLTNPMYRIVFMGTPDFAVPSLQALIETQNVVGVVTQPDRPAGRGKQLRPSPVKVAALEAGLPIFQPYSLRKREQAEQLVAWQPDAIVVAAFGQILRPHVLELPPLGCINVHASLLPRWRGSSPIQHAIMAGDEQSGVCLMQMERGLDTGAVYACEAIPLDTNETAATLHDKLAELGAELVRCELPCVLAGEIVPTPQDEALVTYARMIRKGDGEIDWRDSAEKIDRHIRAFTPWPSAFTFWQGKQLKIIEALPVPIERKNHAIGQVISVKNRITVLTGDGGLQLLKVQLQGKRVTPIDDFVRGRPTFINSNLHPTT